MGASSAQFARDRDAARAEVARVHQARADQLAALLGAGIAESELEQVRRFAAELPGVLGQAWRAFIDLPSSSQIDVLSGAGWADMPWHSLLQCNPYARLRRWTPVRLRAY